MYIIDQRRVENTEETSHAEDGSCEAVFSAIVSSRLFGQKPDKHDHVSSLELGTNVIFPSWILLALGGM